MQRLASIKPINLFLLGLGINLATADIVVMYDNDWYVYTTFSF
jgi:SNF2 family DNA or RNA helicase